MPVFLFIFLNMQSITTVNNTDDTHIQFDFNCPIYHEYFGVVGHHTAGIIEFS